MLKFRYAICVITLFIVISFFFCANAHAYLDPGTGSYLFQLIIAGILGGLFAIKLFWVKIKLGLTKFFPYSEEKNKE